MIIPLVTLCIDIGNFAVEEFSNGGQTLFAVDAGSPFSSFICSFFDTRDDFEDEWWDVVIVEQ